jgi:hypothetical protein
MATSRCNGPQTSLLGLANKGGFEPTIRANTRGCEPTLAANEPRLLPPARKQRCGPTVGAHRARKTCPFGKNQVPH